MIRLFYVLMAGIIAALQGVAWADPINMPVGVTEISHAVYGLHMIIFTICVVIGVGVIAAILYSVIMHRQSRRPEAAQFHENTSIEIVWTLIPFLILVVMAVPAAGTLINIYDSSGSDMTIKVTGYQWKWGYDYIGEDFGFISELDEQSRRATLPGSSITPRQVENYLLEVDHPMVVPVGSKVRLLITSVDVIHSWWVPALGMKKDAIPGVMNEMWFRIEEPGSYRGQCAELCGAHHAFMPIVVEALPQDDYDAWLKEQKKNHAA